VIRATERITGSTVPYDIVDRRLGDPASTYAAASFAEEALGWTAKHDLDPIIRTAYDWHRSQL